LENASYALKMAAGVLLAVLILSIMTFILNNYTQTQKTILESKKSEKVVEFNEQFQAYEKAQMYGTDVISCLNLAYSINLENRVWDNMGLSGTSRIIAKGESGLNEKAITVEIYLKNPLKSSIRLSYFNPAIRRSGCRYSEI
jgi:hypothetical protein